jgi:hypothetical protein
MLVTAKALPQRSEQQSGDEKKSKPNERIPNRDCRMRILVSRG